MSYGGEATKWDFKRIITADKKQEHALSSLEVCMILLVGRLLRDVSCVRQELMIDVNAELGVEHIVELCDHLQVVFHVIFLNLDSLNPLIHRHARIFLVNLIYSLTSGQG